MINTNLKFWRRELSLTQAQLADKLSIKRSLIGAYEEGRAEPKLTTLVKMARLFGISLDALVTTDFSKKRQAAAVLRQLQNVPALDAAATAVAGTDGAAVAGVDKASGENLRVLAITVDKNQNENIELVPLKAAAGYLNGYADQEYIEDLPKFRLPMLGQTGTFRAFEISGDSMLPIASGTVIVGRYVSDWNEVKDGTPCIVVSKKEGIVFKRVFNRLKEAASLTLHSDNPVYSPYEIDVEDVLEIWEAKSYISSTFPIADLSLNRLASIVLDLQKQVTTMKKA
ncbi:helix-turn-helix domain-containing protein [Hymenobacter busanensis]|uniref:Helix-turn-helix domain-containing protein n=1 Tax=Hymenobacter busanensis TaxID=2607656 RepID=A0A7L4ZSS3_9BACT|nr:LexA family transcriptional regulator [Hymenobacter busanensis]KAA9327511.1 helix-turn-helix domain-containing protein [Hymenobacter busanensis]QHJ06151.1 helix-turn-helix domain-containing protein [Hymenobacter busanensis]